MTRLNKILLSSVVLIAGFGLSFSQAHAAMLRGAAEIAGKTIMLGDLFDGLAPDQAGLEILHAPKPGKTLSLDARSLWRIARAARVDWSPATPYDRITLTRAAQIIDADRLNEALKAAWRSYHKGSHFELILDNRLISATLPVDAPASIEIADIRLDKLTNRFQAEVIIAAGHEAKTRLSLSGRVFEMVSVPIPARRINRGQVIGKNDLIWKKMRASSVGTDVILSSKTLIGQAAVRSLAPGRLMRDRDIQAPRLVSRGDLVTIRLENARMTLTVLGKALGEGAQGDTVRVINTTSNRIIEASIIGSGEVQVVLAQNMR